MQDSRVLRVAVTVGLSIALSVCIWHSGSQSADYVAASAKADVLLVTAADSPTWSRRMAQFRCPGAKDQTVLQVALNTAAATGKKVRLAAGTFSLSATLLVPSNCTLEGEARDYTLLNLANGVNNPNLANAAWNGAGNTKITLRGLTINGNRANQTPASWTIKDSLNNSGAVFFNKCSFVTVENCRIDDAAVAALNLSESTDSVLRGNAFNNSNDDSIGLDLGCTRALVADNTIVDCGKNNTYGSPCGIEIEDGSSQVIVQGNHIAANKAGGGKGIVLKNHPGQPAAHDVTIMNNIVTEGYVGIYVWSADTATPYNVAIVGNQVLITKDPDCLGYALFRGRDLTMTGNLYHKNYAGGKGYGLTLQQLTNTVIANNVLEVATGGSHTSDIGIYVGDHSGYIVDLVNVAIRNNTLNFFDYALFYVNGQLGLTATDWVIQDNVMTTTSVTTNAFSWYDAVGGVGGTFTRCACLGNLVSGYNTNLHYKGANSNFGNASWTVDTLLYGLERTTDPAKPPEGGWVMWLSDGTGLGDDGDVIIGVTAGGSSKYTIVHDHSGATAW